MLAALRRLGDGSRAELHDECKAHVGDGSAAVEPALLLHLRDNVPDGILLVFVECKLRADQPVALDHLACGEPQRETRLLCVILDEVTDAVDAAVYCAAVVRFIAEILPERFLLIVCDVDCVLDQLVDALILRRGDRHDRHAEQLLHHVDIYAAAVCGQLIHHIERNDRRDVHFEELHCQIEIALDIRDIDDVDDRMRLFLQNKITRDDLLAAVRRHRIDAGQVGDERVGMPLDRAVLAVNGDAGKIADMLLGAGQAVEERGLAAVLIADQCKLHDGALRERITVARKVESAALTESGMLGLLLFRLLLFGFGCSFCVCDGDLLGIGEAERKLIAVEPQLHRVAHRGELHDRDLRAGNDAHIEKMLTECAVAAECFDPCSLPGFDFPECCHKNLRWNSSVYLTRTYCSTIAEESQCILVRFF